MPHFAYSRCAPQFSFLLAHSPSAYLVSLKTLQNLLCIPNKINQTIENIYKLNAIPKK